MGCEHGVELLRRGKVRALKALELRVDRGVLLLHALILLLAHKAERQPLARKAQVGVILPVQQAVLAA